MLVLFGFDTDHKKFVAKRNAKQRRNLEAVRQAVNVPTDLSDHQVAQVHAKMVEEMEEAARVHLSERRRL